jgi:hypothetical protein
VPVTRNSASTEVVEVEVVELANVGEVDLK